MKLTFDFTYADGQVINTVEGEMNNLFRPKNKKENVFCSTLGPTFMLM
jgi:hypothetical protein